MSVYFFTDFRHFLESIIGSEDNSRPRVWDIPGKSPDLSRVGSPKTACRKPGGKNEDLPTHLPHLFLVFTSRAPGAPTVFQHETARGLHGAAQRMMSLAHNVSCGDTGSELPEKASLTSLPGTRACREQDEQLCMLKQQDVRDSPSLC